MEDQEYRAILEQLVCPDYGVLASLRPYCLPRKNLRILRVFFRWTFGAKWWMNRTKLGLCMLYLRNEVNTTHIYFRIIDFRIHYFRDPVVNPPEFRKTSLTGRFLLTVLIWVWSSRWETRNFFQNPKKGANGIRKDIDSLTNQYITYLHGSLTRYYYMTSWCMI